MHLRQPTPTATAQGLTQGWVCVDALGGNNKNKKMKLLELR